MAAAFAPLLLGGLVAPAQAADVGADHTPKPQEGPGSLDRTFGGDGKVSTPVGDGGSSGANAVAVQADGKVVTGGRAQFQVQRPDGQGTYTIALAVLARYNVDGTLDDSFGEGGLVRLDVLPDALTPGTNVFSSVFDVVVQPDGQIVAVGSVDNQFPLPSQEPAGSFSLVVRLNPDGSFDSSFDGDGIALNDFSPGEPFEGHIAVTLQPDGKIVAAGETGDPSFNSIWTVVRYNADGSLDASFDGDGVVTMPAFNSARGVVIQPDGKITATGWTTFFFGSDFALARYNADGSPDATFGTGGFVTTDVGANDRANGLALQTDGKMVVVGSSFNSSQSRSLAAVARYNADGALDTSFGINGTHTTSFDGLAQSEFAAVVLQANGKIVASGRSGPSPNSDFVLVRYNTNGVPDLTFGGDGTVRTDFDTGPDTPEDLALYPDGRLVAAGDAGVDGFRQFGVARYLGDPVLSVVCPGQDITNVIYGSEGADEIEGTPGNDLIYGLGGPDVITGGRGEDCIYGGPGKDTIDGGRLADVIHIDAGDAKAGSPERIDGSFGNDTLALGPGLTLDNVNGNPPKSVNDPVTGGLFRLSNVEDVSEAA